MMIMKKSFIIFCFCFIAIGLQAQNTHYVDVRVREANTPNYKVESSYEPLLVLCPTVSLPHDD